MKLGRFQVCALVVCSMAAGCLAPTESVSSMTKDVSDEMPVAPVRDAGGRPDSVIGKVDMGVMPVDATVVHDARADEHAVDMRPPDLATGSRVYRCDRYKTTREVETLLIARTCGGHDCHAGGADGFDPVLIPSPLAPILVDKPAHANCATARFIDTRDPEQSFLLIKVRGPGAEVTCPDGKPGGARMPFEKPMLAKAELDCLAWYVHELAKAASK